MVGFEIDVAERAGGIWTRKSSSESQEKAGEATFLNQKRRKKEKGKGEKPQCDQVALGWVGLGS